MKFLKLFATDVLPPMLGRWCVRTSEKYSMTCQPELKANQANYDNGYETMKMDKKKNEHMKTMDPATRLFASWGW
jgi:hypothetical protein